MNVAATSTPQCAEDEKTRELVLRRGALRPLVSLLSRRENKQLLAAATGAIWKCSIGPKNAEKYVIPPYYLSLALKRHTEKTHSSHTLVELCVYLAGIRCGRH